MMASSMPQFEFLDQMDQTFLSFAHEVYEPPAHRHFAGNPQTVTIDLSIGRKRLTILFLVWP